MLPTCAGGGCPMPLKEALRLGTCQQVWAELVWMGSKPRPHRLLSLAHFEQAYSLVTPLCKRMRDMKGQRTLQESIGTSSMHQVEPDALGVPRGEDLLIRLCQ